MEWKRTASIQALANDAPGVFDREDIQAEDEIEVVAADVVARTAGALSHFSPGSGKPLFPDISRRAFSDKDNARIHHAVGLDMTGKTFQITPRG